MEDKIRYRHNIMNINSIKTFANLKGGCHQGCRDVYFIRALGVDKNLLYDVQEMDEQMNGRMQEGKLLYKRIAGLPALASAEKTDYYASCCETWLSGGQQTIETRLNGMDERLFCTLSAACQTVLALYESGRAGVSASVKKNFMVKLLYWFDALMEDFLTYWDEHSCIKIVADNITKEQEYLFFYLLTLIGCDVLLIQSKADIELRKEYKELSKELVLGEYAACTLPPYRCPPVGKETKNAAVPPIEMRRPSPELQVQAMAERVTIHLPERTRKRQSASVSVSMPAAKPGVPSGEAAQNIEKSFEELARLASSVVMIAVHDHTGEIIGTGSGIMIGRGGYILTNNHVANGGKFYSVRIEDDENTYQTDEVIKYHSVLDLAILRIDRNLSPLAIYQGQQALVRGQKVVAIGSPLGLFNSVSDGIISGFRVIDSVDMIQFTAPTSPGSSGGAVLNMSGEVIGISTAGIDRAQNINLAMGYECINPFIKGFTQ